MTRINEIGEAAKNVNPLKLDKESSARIVKRSLWMHAVKKGKQANENADEHQTLAKRVKQNNQ